MRTNTFLALTVLTLSPVLFAQRAAERPLPLRRPSQSQVEAAPDRLLVQHRSGADNHAIEQSFQVHGASVVRHHAALSLSVITVDPARRDQIRASLERTGLFNFVEPDYFAHIDATPNDPDFSSQWHLQTIQAPSAWNIATGSTAAPIAMIDSGVDTTHPDLAAKLTAGWSFLTGTSDVQDTQGHGTATAGTAAALTNNGAGVAGVAWQNPIMPLVVVDSTGYASYSDIASAITYAADHGARVVNISIGGTSASSTMQSAVNYAWNKGTVVFASAGNGGANTLYYPAACQNVVSVGATDSTDTVASFSNFSNGLSLTAPGVNILTTSNGGGYGYWSGTSFSSPVAAGVAALVLGYAPALSASALVNVLEKNADDLGAPGYDQYYGWGRVNAYKALLGTGSSVDTTPPTVAISSPSNSATVSGSIAVQGTATDNVGVASIVFYVDGNLAATAYSSPFSFSWNTTSASNSSHNLTVKAYDAANNVGQSSVTVAVNNVAPPPISDTQPPTVYIRSPITVSRSSVQITAIASDDVSVTQVCIYVDGVLHYTGSVAPYTLNLNTKKISAGTHSVTAKAWDPAGNMGVSAPVTFIK